MTTAEDIYCTLEQMGDERQARNLSRFFKTGKGDYGEGDRFLGLKCPQTRMVVHEARLDVSFEEIEKLLYSEWHEVRFAGSDNLWEQRIGMVTTWRLMRAGQTDDTFRLADKLLHHPHDLMRKAVGWMLREAGKVDKDLLLDFLEEHYHEMSRTTLRYAIERLPEPERQYWLKRQ